MASAFNGAGRLNTELLIVIMAISLKLFMCWL